MRMVRTKRVHDPVEHEDGYRVLVDRLWPRGVRKQDLVHDEWMKKIAPSGALRRWFGHAPERFEAFAERYRRELEGNEEFDHLAEIATERPVTLLYAAKDREHNHAVVLAESLEKRLRAD
ncbi:DUF488 domain-containing protein [Guyparkeria hydrothermalis]|uniref:DUF488 domain-containing protein n=1 Tax=Guyparkeria hydrothermalis TaxID=923 RepID=UPI0020201092|nr:DUF488 domain-containing protein [Guyparkeria hydrothermalis]MCL7743472.1 DUF488 domain-containing protein [Guyparkeria hydrothermalis]